MKVAIVCCLHGDEPYGLEVERALPPSFSFFVGNRVALERKTRYIEKDMNRCFPGRKDGSYEERRAYYLTRKLRRYDYVIDLHSTSNDCLLFGIITNPNREKIEFAKRLGLKKLVIMPEFFAGGKALIDFVKCGISLEIGPHEKKENVMEVLRIIKNFLNDNRNEDIEIFEVFDLIKRGYSEVLIYNFDEVKKGQIISREGVNRQRSEFNFVAILVNERAYENILCLACRRINALAGI